MGVGDLLIENFQYVAIGGITADAGSVILLPGVNYTIGFYTAVFLQSDGMVIFDGFHTINPVIDYVGFGVADFTDGLQMPTGASPGTHRWGPSFLFDVVPAPTAAPLLGGAFLWRRRRRRRQSYSTATSPPGTRRLSSAHPVLNAQADDAAELTLVVRDQCDLQRLRMHCDERVERTDRCAGALEFCAHAAVRVPNPIVKRKNRRRRAELDQERYMASRPG